MTERQTQVIGRKFRGMVEGSHRRREIPQPIAEQQVQDGQGREDRLPDHDGELVLDDGRVIPRNGMWLSL